MSSSNPGHEDEEEDEDAERLFSLSLPPQTPSTNLFIDSPSFLPEDLIGFTDDFSLLFPDDHCIQNIPSPYPSVLDNTSTSTSNVTHQQNQHYKYQATEQVGGGGIALIAAGQGQDQQITSGHGEVGPSSSTLVMEMKQKKMDHNAKERVRRQHLNASYLTLRSLLPDTQKPKEKWSGPYIIDRALDHIQQVEGEIEKLKSNKEDMTSELERVHNLRQAQDLQEQALSVTINEITKGQLIIQVCHHRNKPDILSEILYRLESQGMEVLDASVFDPCQDRSCYHIRIQMDETSIGDDYAAELKDKLVSWFILY